VLFVLKDKEVNEDIVQYYSQRASEYEQIYQKPERQKDLERLKDLIREAFEGRGVLEIACGTGYWTQFIAERARSICATDRSWETLELAKQKNYKECTVSFIESDAYSLKNIEGCFDGGFCGFWWSHIPKSQISVFIHNFQAKLTKDSLVMMIDNRYVKGSSTPVSRTDSDGNTYQIRKLRDGTEHEILKNFPDEEELKALLSPFAQDIRYISLEYYWLVEYSVANNLHGSICRADEKSRDAHNTYRPPSESIEPRNE